jgi:hypothetical protein
MRRRLVAERRKFVLKFDELRQLADDAVPQGRSKWKGMRTYELLAVGAYTAWEELTHRAVILNLAQDTTTFSHETGLLLSRRITEGNAEAILTARLRTSFDRAPKGP